MSDRDARAIATWATRIVQEFYPEDDAAEYERERRWDDFVMACRAFAESEPDGFAACNRALAEAMKGQKVMFR